MFKTDDGAKYAHGLQEGEGLPSFCALDALPRPEDNNVIDDEATAEAAWPRVKRRLRAELGEDVYASWFGRLEFESVNRQTAYLTVPTRFLKSWIESHYADRVLALYKTECPHLMRVTFGVRGSVNRDNKGRSPAQTRNVEPLRPSATSNGMQQANISSDSSLASTVKLSSATSVAPSMMLASSEDAAIGDFGGNPLDNRLTFSNFLIGNSNALAHAAAERVARHADGPALYNPFYLHAGVGLGKTHLLQAIAHEARAQGKKFLYLTADRFMYSFVAALKAQTALTFKEKLRAIDLLIIDDVQFLQGKSIQQEFGHTINSLIDAGRQIVVAADRPPSDLDSLDERVCSRLAGGLVVEINALDEDLRARILASRIEAVRAVNAGFQVSDSVVSYVASVIATNGRDLDGAVNRLLAHTTLTGAPLTLETAEAAIRDLIRTREPRRVKIEDIQKLVAGRYNVSRAEILSERRTAAVVKPRQIAMYLSKVLTLRSLPEIGRRFGGRDHTTVLHAVRKIEKMANEDAALREELELLKRMLQE